MIKIVFPLLLSLAISSSALAGDFQGVLTDWRCTEKMVKNGREKTLKDDGSCSLRKNSARSNYGLITDEKKFYRLDPEGIRLARELLNNSHDKDNLRVLARGELDGNTIKVTTMTIL